MVGGYFSSGDFYFTSYGGINRLFACLAKCFGIIRDFYRRRDLVGDVRTLSQRLDSIHQPLMGGYCGI